MFRFELYKSLRKIEIWVIAAVCIFLRIVTASGSNVILPRGVNLKIYQYYIGEMAGTYTDEKNEWLIGERDRFQELLNNEEYYKEQYNHREISAEEYREILSDIDLAKSRMDTLEFLVQKSQYLKMIYDSGEKGVAYFYDMDVEDYIKNMGTDVFLILMIIVIVVNIFNEDFNCGTHYMVQTSAYGRRKLYRNRILCTLLIAGLCGIIFPVIEYLVKQKCFQLGNLNASIKCLQSMGECGMSLSIKRYIGLCIVLRFISSLFFGVLVMAVAEKSHNNIVCYIITFAIVYLPDVMYGRLKGLVMKSVALCRGFDTYKAFGIQYHILGINSMIVWFMVYFMVSVLVVVLLRDEKD